MRVIIAGGRNFQPEEIHRSWLDWLHSQIQITQVVCGMSLGADMFGHQWATENNISIVECPADWRRLGFAAGPRRNALMAEKADACVLFPGGKGTTNMLTHAKAKGLVIYDWRSEGPETD